MVNKWLIWSNEHRMWWRPNGNGYTESLTEAGRYPASEALKICRSIPLGDEFPVHENDTLSKLNLDDLKSMADALRKIR